MFPRQRPSQAAAPALQDDHLQARQSGYPQNPASGHQSSISKGREPFPPAASARAWHHLSCASQGVGGCMWNGFEGDPPADPAGLGMGQRCCWVLALGSCYPPKHRHQHNGCCQEQLHGVEGSSEAVAWYGVPPSTQASNQLVPDGKMGCCSSQRARQNSLQGGNPHLKIYDHLPRSHDGLLGPPAP